TAMRRIIEMVHAPTRHGERILQAHGLWVAEVETPEPFSDNQGILPIWRKIQVVGIINLYCLPFFACRWIDLRQTVPLIVEHPQRLHIVGRHDMLRLCTGRKALKDLVSGGIDDIDGVADTIGDIEAYRETLDNWAELVWSRLGIDVMRIKHW